MGGGGRAGDGGRGVKGWGGVGGGGAGSRAKPLYPEVLSKRGNSFHSAAVMSTSEASPADDEVAGSTGPDPEAGGGACSTPPRCSPSRASPPPPSPAYSPTSTSPSWREHLKRCPEAHGTERLASSSHFKFASVSPCKSVTLRERVMTVRMLSGGQGAGLGGGGVMAFKFKFNVLHVRTDRIRTIRDDHLDFHTVPEL